MSLTPSEQGSKVELHQFEFLGNVCTACGKTFDQLTALGESLLCDGGITT